HGYHYHNEVLESPTLLSFEVVSPGGVLQDGKVLNANSSDLSGSAQNLQVGASFKLVVGYPVDPAHTGQWLQVYKGEKRWLRDYSPVSLTEVDNNTLKATTSDGATEYYIRAGISDVAVQGALNALNGGTSTAGTTLAGASYSGVGGIDVVLSNLEDDQVERTVTTDSQGAFTGKVPSGEYQVSAQTGDGSGGTQTVDARVTVEGQEDALGVFTLNQPEDYNFKTALVDEGYGSQTDDELVYFWGPTYNKKLVITNVGHKDASGLSFTISSSDSDVQSLTYDNVLSGLAPGDSVDVPVTMRFSTPSAQKKVTFDVVITDIDGRTWNDTFSVPLSPHTAIGINTESATYGIHGYLIAPGRRPVRLGGTDR
ncbi:MAG TPA: hypothetical protein VKA48_09900, partial [Gammaproteobacteria bacterium]|nr:hypothetical protein [Gammaproteobacteria bacterium]